MTLFQRINSIRHTWIAEKNSKARRARQTPDAKAGIYSDHQKSRKAHCPHCKKPIHPSTFTCPHCKTTIATSGEAFSLHSMQLEVKAAFMVHMEKFFFASYSGQGNPQKKQRYLSEGSEAALRSTITSSVA